MKTYVSILSVVVGILAYLLIIVTTVEGTGEGLSISTFGLWSAIGYITFLTMFQQGANPAVPLIYAAGASVVTVVLVAKGQYGTWSTFDTVIAALVVICILLWVLNGARMALIMSIAANVTASVPYIVLTWQNPNESPFLPNFGFFIANVLAFVGAKAWTIEDRLYPGANIVMCALLVLPCLLF